MEQVLQGTAVLYREKTLGTLGKHNIKTATLRHYLRPKGHLFRQVLSDTAAIKAVHTGATGGISIESSMIDSFEALFDNYEKDVKLAFGIDFQVDFLTF